MDGEGEVVHLVAHRLTDLSAELASIGNRGGTFPLPHSRGDQAKTGGGQDSHETLGRKAREIYVRALHINTIKVTMQDFR